MKIKEGNILDVTDGIICHQVNCRKVMGAGLALQIARKWPDVESAYVNKPVWKLGECQVVQAGEGLFVANLSGQDGVGGGLQTDYEALEQALTLVAEYAEKMSLPLHLPYGIGCGLAGGDWEGVVAPMIERVAPFATIHRFDPRA